METLVLTIDTIAFIAILYYSLKNEKSEGESETGPFRISRSISTPKNIPKSPEAKSR